jgi:hypothetical protein
MGKSLTLNEAIARFEPMMTTGIDVNEAIQEAVDRIYELGRYPGTTLELALAEVDFVSEGDDGDYFLYFLESTYDGAIGFRTASRGWSVVDQVALYKDGVNMGDREFVDLGTVLVADVEQRKYRCPVGWVPSGGPYYALMKLEAPVLDEGSIIPVKSVSALKAAIQAVCYEYVNDVERAQGKWAEFDAFMTRAAKQTDGPKRYTMGMDSSLKRKPKQFQ